MVISKEDWKNICEYEDGLYWDTDRMSSDGRYYLNKLTKKLRDVEKENNNFDGKIYVIFNDFAVNGESSVSVVSATLSKKEAKKMLDGIVNQIKKDSNFDDLDIMNYDKVNEHNECAWYYSESNSSFELFINGEYNLNHYSVILKEFDINREKKNEKEIE